MTFSDETVMAYADGELDAESRTAIEVAVKTDRQLAERVARHQKMRHVLQTAFDGVLREPVPDRLIATAKDTPAGSATVIELASVRNAKAPTHRRPWSWPEWTAIAASLIVGVFAGYSALRSSIASHNTPIVAKDGGVVAAGGLATALSQSQSGSRTKDGVEIGFSFRAKSGDFCRTFVVRRGETLTGIACNLAREWRIQTLAQSTANAADEQYRAAASPLSPIILKAVEDLIAGEALDIDQETQARQRNWQP